MKPESLKPLGKIDLIGTAGVSSLEQFRRGAPIAAAKMTEVLVDNPGQFLLISAGSMVTAKMALNLMKPRTPAEALALFIVLQVTLSKGAWMAVEKGWIRFRVRDDDGKLVPLLTGETQ